MSENRVYGSRHSDELVGTADSDELEGLYGDDSLSGGDGDDHLRGGRGRDTLVGGQGNDVYWVDRNDDLVVESASEGIDKVYAEISYTLGDNLEELSLRGRRGIFGQGNALDNKITGSGRSNELWGEDGNDTLAGWGGNDRLYGGEGNDRLFGILGRDTLVGGEGDDTYEVNNRGDRVIEASDEGEDTVFAYRAYTLSDHVENLRLKGKADRGTGNDLDNSIIGNARHNRLGGLAGEDTLLGYGGKDRLAGGDGNDLLDGGSDRDQLFGGAGDDSLLGGTGNDLLFGEADDDQLDGGAGNDRLIGGTGADTLTGGAGSDRYIFRLGDGEDVLREVASGSTDTTDGDIDRLALGDGVTANQVAFFRSGDDLFLQFSANDRVQILDGAAAPTLNGASEPVDTRIERFELADGSYLEWADVAEILDAITQFASDNSLTFSSVDDVYQNSTLRTQLATFWNAAPSDD